MSDLAIHLQALKFRYGDGPWILDIDEIQIKRSESVFLLGPSGSGKTTLLGILTGILNVTNENSKVEVLGRSLKNLTLSQRDRFRGDHIGYIFQLFNLIPYLNVEQNIQLSAEMSGVRRSRLKRSLSTETQELASALGLTEYTQTPVTHLSVGQQQRVAAARALLGNPELIVADEPTSALDHDHRENFVRLLFEQCKRTGSTLIFVSHDRSLSKFFDRSIDLSSLLIKSGVAH